MGPVQIEMLDGLDVIVLRGNAQDVAQVTDIINQIERHEQGDGAGHRDRARSSKLTARPWDRCCNRSTTRSTWRGREA